MKDALSSALVQYLLPLAASALFAAGVWAVAKLGTLLGARAKDSKLNAALVRLTVAVDSIVHDLEATLKPKLAAATADGVLTTAEISNLRTVALTRLKDDMGSEGLKALRDCMGIFAPSLDTFLLGFIETRVKAIPGPTVVMAK